MTITDRAVNDVNPGHYRREGKECIDEMPTYFRRWVEQNTARLAPVFDMGTIRMAWTFMMIGFCVGNAFKYRWRAGEKEGEPRDRDETKAKWYDAFADHLLQPSLYRDPRDRRS